MTSPLSELVKNIEKKKTLAAREPGFDPITRRIRLGKINRAKEDLSELLFEYKVLLRSRAAFILLTGSNADKFNSVATEDFGCFSVNADDFYKDITARVNQRMYTNYTTSPNLFDQVSSEFEDMA